MPRIHLYSTETPTEDGHWLLPPAPSHHLLRVLRGRPGQELTLFTGDGRDYPAELLGARGKQALLAVGRARWRDTGSPLQCCLWLPVIRAERWDWALQKATELGAWALQPVVCRHSLVPLAEARAPKRQQRWRDIVIAACEQSSATRIPELRPAMALSELGPPEVDLAVVCDPSYGTSLGKVLGTRRSARRIALLCGPEGGLHPEELAWAESLGFLGAHLGPRILRAETASITALTLAQGFLGDLGG
ncbi:MAG: 16S rRNA (uracil(1498)-N(3))-methyltransferase [Acidithiobacillus caldus]|nr:16S rRNA (uracil(1498)-N(3))-methyltransferase [Acidithiobacillus caldus]